MTIPAPNCVKSLWPRTLPPSNQTISRLNAPVWLPVMAKGMSGQPTTCATSFLSNLSAHRSAPSFVGTILPRALLSSNIRQGFISILRFLRVNRRVISKRPRWGRYTDTRARWALGWSCREGD